MTADVVDMTSGNDRPGSGKILSLETRQRRLQQIDRIEQYWNSVRGKRLVPSRCEIDPRGLEGVLGHAFILERIAGGLARFRIAGSHVSALSGLELRQMPISALFLPGTRDTLSDALRAVFDEPATVRLSVVSPEGFGRPRLEGEMILLPLRSDLGDIDRLLGGLVFEGGVGRTPRRIDITGEERRSLIGYAGPAHAAPVHDAPRARPSAPVPATVTRGHLRLVVSND